MTFNIFATQRVFGLSYYDRVDDLISLDPCGDKAPSCGSSW